MIHRLIETHIQEALLDTPVVFLMGPRQSGKTTIAKQIMNDQNWIYYTLDDTEQLILIKNDPTGFIRNSPADKSIIIDEIQRLPELFVSIKQSVDENRRPGRFLLTGSANALLLPQLADSLAGRMEIISIHTLSECEIKNITPTFLDLLQQGIAPTTSETRVRNYLIERIIKGCFPEPFQRDKERRVVAWYNNYMNTLIQRDIRDLGHIEHHETMQKLLEILALYSGHLLNFSELGEQVGLNRITTKKYVLLLEQLFLVETLRPWHTSHYKRLIKTPKIHLVDTGLICAIRNINKTTLIHSPHLLGSLLETFVFNELKKQLDFSDARLHCYHYRDKDKVEIDILLENPSGEIIAIEIKAAATVSSKDLTGLKKLADLVQDKLKIGILLYDGDHTTAFGERLFAVPIAALWS